MGASLWAEKVEDSTTRLSLENSESERLWGCGWTLASGDDFAPLFEGKVKERETLKANGQTGREIAAARFSHTLSLGGFIYWFFFSMQVLSLTIAQILGLSKKHLKRSGAWLGLADSKS